MSMRLWKENLGPSALSAFFQGSPFKADADAELARFQAIREDLEKQIGRGDLTLKVARERAQNAVDQLRDQLHKKSEGYSPAPRAFLDRLNEEGDARKRARENMSLESLQRETNKLLKQSLVEQQLASRAPEFEGRAFMRPMTGGPAAPTLDSLLDFHQTARNAGDDAALEWGRRQLEAFRPRVPDDQSQAVIDRACDRPDQVNPRLVGKYTQAMQDADPDSLDTFVRQSLDARDSNACLACYMLARQSPEGTRPRWTRTLLKGISQFPDAALETARSFEAEARQREADAARAHSEFAIAQAAAQLPLDAVAPSSDDLARRARVFNKPIAQPDEPIGLALDRRGIPADDFDSSLRLATP